MSKHTVTMKTLLDENATLKIRVHQLETERKAPQKFWDYRFTAGMTVGWLLGWAFNSLVFPRWGA
jgi:hypothetical protein